MSVRRRRNWGGELGSHLEEEERMAVRPQAAAHLELTKEDVMPKQNEPLLLEIRSGWAT
jgi:hypothetical protein